MNRELSYSEELWVLILAYGREVEMVFKVMNVGGEEGNYPAKSMHQVQRTNRPKQCFLRK
jgi:hypothetical protein